MQENLTDGNEQKLLNALVSCFQTEPNKRQETFFFVYN
ncbi:hypothetical protein GM3708_3587 (plasmid) [Geminocystis sp. NIES-3708]|nr:hypothetical protein GM3708_3587 [Geminocystis sp. NIES-3708]